MSGSTTSERALRIFVVAGEHSGDALGAKLMPALAALHGGPIEYAGVGGGFTQKIDDALKRIEGVMEQNILPLQHLKIGIGALGQFGHGLHKGFEIVCRVFDEIK